MTSHRSQNHLKTLTNDALTAEQERLEVLIRKFGRVKQLLRGQRARAISSLSVVKNEIRRRIIREIDEAIENKSTK